MKKLFKQYKYAEVINQENLLPDFKDDYSFFANKDNLKNNPNAVYAVLHYVPNCHHIAAKNLLFQEKDECWKFFDRTAHFLTYGQFSDYIDDVSPALMYGLFLQRQKLIEISLSKLGGYLEKEVYKANQDYIGQAVYPSSYLIHFLIKKYAIENPLYERILEYGKGPGLYKRIIDEWDSKFSEIEPAYWNSLCDYHLENLKGSKREDSEHLWYGLVPMELLNIFIVRKRLGLDIPVIDHELFKTPMAKYPPDQTGYSPELDAKFQLAYRTVQQQKKFSYEEIVAMIKQEFGEGASIFY